MTLPWGSAATGVVNLLSGGRLNTTVIRTQSAGAMGVFNFHGGTVLPMADAPAFMQGIKYAYVQQEGAVIDTAGYNIGIAQSLLSPFGYGVVGINTNNMDPALLSGFLAEPVVRLTGGNGSNATARALFDPVTGAVTNFVITSSGVGYWFGDSIVITLIGGGKTNIIFGGNHYTLAPLNTNGGLTKLGGGTLILTGTNTYNGPTVIAGGTLQLGNNTFYSNLTFGAVTDNGRLAFGNTNNLIFANTISGTGVVAALGQGELTLTAANTYSGGTVIGGPLAGSILANTSQVNVLANNNLGTGGITIDAAGRLSLAAAGLNITNALVLNTAASAGRASVEAATGVSTYGGPITILGGGAGGHFGATSSTAMLVVTGFINAAPGVPVVVAMGSNSFSGGGNYTGFVINQDTTRIGAHNGLSTAAVLTVGQTGPATFNLNGFNQQLAGLVGTTAAAASVTNTSGTLSTLTLDVARDSVYSYAGALGTNIALVKNGLGAQYITGVNRGLRSLTLNAGLLVADSTNAIGINTLNWTFNGGAIGLTNALALPAIKPSSIVAAALTPAQAANDLDFFAGGLGATNLFLGAILGSTIDYTNVHTPFGSTYRLGGGGGTLIYGGKISGTSNLWVGAPNSTGTVILTNANDYTGWTLINTNLVLQIGNNTPFGSLGSGAVTNFGTLVFARSDGYTANNNITGPGGVLQAGSGVTTLGGNNLGMTGAVTVTSGALMVTTTNAFGTGPITVTGGGAIGAVFGGAAWGQDFLDLLNARAAAPITGSIVLGSDSTSNLNFALPNLVNAFFGAAGGEWHYDPGIVFTNNTYNLGGGGGTLVFDDPIASTRNLVGYGTTNLVVGPVGGSGTVVFTNDNKTYLGFTRINPGNTLQIGSNDVTGSIGKGTIFNDGTLTFSRADTYTLTNGMVIGSGGINQNGSGTLVFNGNFYNSNGLTVNAGSVILTNATINGQLAIKNNALVVAVGGTGLIGEFYQLNAGPITTNLTTIPAMQFHFMTNNPVVLHTIDPATNAFDYLTAGGTPNVRFPYPWNGVVATNIEARWRGTFNAPTTGYYNFRLLGDDLNSIWIDGTNVVYNASSGVTSYGQIYLNAGAHNIILVFNQGTGGYNIMADVAVPGRTAPPNGVVTDGRSRLLNSFLSSGPAVYSLSGDAGATLLLSNATLMIAQTNNATFAGTITNVGGGGLYKLGLSTLTLTGTNYLDRGIILGAGTLSVGNDDNLGGTANPLTFEGGVLRITGTAITNLNAHAVNWGSFNGGFDIADPSHTFYITDVIGGPGGVSLYGAGTQVMQAANTYTGGTFIAGGVLRVANASALGSAAGRIAVAGGTLDLNGYNWGSSNFSLTAGQVTDHSSVPGETRLTLSNMPTTTVLGGVFRNGDNGRRLGLTITGGGVVMMTNNNTYTGTTRLDGGTLTSPTPTLFLSGAVGALSGSTNITIADTAILILTNNAVLTNNNANRVNDAARIRLLDGNLFFMNDATNAVYSETAGVLDLVGGNNTIFMRQAGPAGTNLLVFAGVERSTSAVLDVTAIGLGTNMQNVLRFTTAPTLVNDILPWATINLTNFATYHAGINSLSNFSDYQTAAFGAWHPTNNVRQIVPFTVTSNLTVNSLNMNLTNAGVLNLGGFTLTNFSGGLLISGQGLILSNGFLTAGNGVNATELIFRVAVSIVTNYATIRDGGAGGAGQVSLVKAGTGVLVMGDLFRATTNFYTGNTFIDQGTLYINSDSNLGAAGGMLVINSATLRVGSNTVSSNITLNTRPVWTRSARAGINVDTGVVLTINDPVFGPGGLLKGGPGTLTLGGANTYEGGTLVTGGVLYVSADNNLGLAGTPLFLGAGGVLRLTNNWVLSRPTMLMAGGGGLDVDSGSTITNTSYISGAGALSKFGAGTLEMAGALSDWTGGFSNFAGTVVVSSDTAFGRGPVFLAGGRLVNAGDRVITNAFGVFSNSIVDVGAGTTLTLSGPAYSTAIGSTSGVGALTKASAGTLVIANNQRYAGGTYVCLLYTS
ncbi:MAG: autotransporter-associated beta strand repeat-containing protein, partial [Anaerolineae bacterium]|nr:autotransporter-associated beta strand repeat-containing protein [Anaerolineae bacterium]